MAKTSQKASYPYSDTAFFTHMAFFDLSNLLLGVGFDGAWWMHIPPDGALPQEKGG